MNVNISITEGLQTQANRATAAQSADTVSQATAGELYRQIGRLYKQLEKLDYSDPEYATINAEVDRLTKAYHDKVRAPFKWAEDKHLADILRSR